LILIHNIKNTAMDKLFCIIILASVLMVSCKKNFIELNPISSPSVDAVYKTDKDFHDAVIGIYAVLRDQYEDFWIYGDLRSDDSWHALGNDPFLVSVDNFSLSSSPPLLINTWRNYYSMINRANFVLSKIASVDSNVVKNKTQYIAEAEFLRAFAYFDLVRIFGDVPLITTPISIEEAYKTGREKVEKIYSDLIIPDFKDAESKLPLNYSGADIGRPTKGAAEALLGRVYLTIKDFKNAEEVLQPMTNMGYALLSNYNDLFDYSKDQHNSEYIFDIEYMSGGLGLGSSFSNKFVPKSAGSVADIFYGIKGGVEEENTPTIAFYNAFDTNDIRRDVTVAKGFYDNDSVFHGFIQIATFTKKYLAPTPAFHDSKVNWKVIRYADVLLMLAEAMNENGETRAAIPYLNQVRERAHLPGYPTSLSQNDTRDKIYNERWFEFGMEGIRWFDLVRTGRALTVMQPFGMQPYMTVFPIPLVEIQIFNDASIMPQNPGYN